MDSPFNSAELKRLDEIGDMQSPMSLADAELIWKAQKMLENFRVEAIAFLKAQGYTIRPPACPECGGAGRIQKVIMGPTYRDGLGRLISSGGTASEPCPRGCPPPMVYN